MKRLCAALCLLLLSACHSSVETVQERPNILFIMTDDHAVQAIGAYGGRLADIAPTPNIDRLAAQGVRFDRATVTNSICAPSRAVIMTGKHSHLNGVRTNGDVFDGSQPTFPKYLQGAGYQTAFFGKWHLKSLPTGFDDWVVLPGQGHYYNPEFITADGKHSEEGYVTDLVTDKALRWLERDRDTQKPFLLMVQHKAPHRSFMPGPDHMTLFDDVEIPEPENLFDDYSTRTEAARTQRMRILEDMTLQYDLKVKGEIGQAAIDWGNPDEKWDESYGRLSAEQKAEWDDVYDRKAATYSLDMTDDDLLRWKYRRYMQDYLGAVADVDDNVGRILDYMDRAGLSEKTIVIYTSDQGFYLGEHGWFDKRFMYEESFRTPLIARWPGQITPGTSSDKLVSNLDLAPTALDVSSRPIPEDMQGLSLLPLFTEGRNTEWRDALYYHYYGFPSVHNVDGHEGVATETHKLIHFFPTDEWELYDTVADPAEMNNLYGQDAYSDLVAQLKTRLSELKERYDVQADEYDLVPSSERR